MAATTVNQLGLAPTMLNHAAYVTHDAQATVQFYTEVMGMELASTIMGDRIPSTGDAFPYFHLFFRMGDGSTMAFFESPGLPPASDMLQLPGQTYDVPLTFGEGTFYFQCDPHVALGMKGHVKVDD